MHREDNSWALSRWIKTIVVPQTGYCHVEQESGDAGPGVAAGESAARNCRHRERRLVRKRLPRKPKWRMRTKPFDSTCKKKRRLVEPLPPDLRSAGTRCLEGKWRASSLRRRALDTGNTSSLCAGILPPRGLLNRAAWSLSGQRAGRVFYDSAACRSKPPRLAGPSRPGPEAFFLSCSRDSSARLP